MHRIACTLAIALSFASTAALADKPAHKDDASPTAKAMVELATPQSSTTRGSVSVEGKRIDYKAVAGTLVLHGSGDEEHVPTASLFYTA